MGAQCAQYCKYQKHCCNDWKVGSNQMASCAQACMMRVKGASKKACLATVNKFASKRGQGGCTLKFGKNIVGLCSTCKDKNGTCPHGVQSAGAGIDGCAVQMTVGKTAVGPFPKKHLVAPRPRPATPIVKPTPKAPVVTHTHKVTISKAKTGTVGTKIE